MAASETSAGEVSVHLVIIGRVQGVGYRAWCKETADDLGLSGWVRNRRDGSVEALARGALDQIQKFTAACGRGQSFAKVADVVRTKALEIPPPGFEQLPTA